VPRFALDERSLYSKETYEVDSLNDSETLGDKAIRGARDAIRCHTTLSPED